MRGKIIFVIFDIRGKYITDINDSEDVRCALYYNDMRSFVASNYLGVPKFKYKIRSFI